MITTVKPSLGLEIGQILFCCAHRLLLRQQIVPGEAGLHFNELAHLAELLDPLEQDQFDHSKPPILKG
jgi:hypothetical protein